MEREEIQKRLKKELDKNRYEHTLGVMYTAGSLAMAYGYDYEKAMIAGLLPVSYTHLTLPTIA